MVESIEKFPKDDFEEISEALKEYHGLFSSLWALTKPVFSDEVGTAAVFFDKHGSVISLKINKDFWNSLSSFHNKLFVIGHELIHVILYHGIRMSKLSKSLMRPANMAMDVVVNHSLVQRFSFSREEFDKDGKYCWVDTVFKKEVVPDDKFYDYYFNLILKNLKEEYDKGKSSSKEKGEKSEGDSDDDESSIGEPDVLDDHSGLDSFLDPEFEKLIEGEIEKNIQEFVEEEIKNTKEQIHSRGCEPGNIFKQADTKKVKKKKKWETVIKRWENMMTKEEIFDVWTKKNRRMIYVDPSLKIPEEWDAETKDKDKIDVYFFQDTSGSCAGFIDRFFAAAKSLDPEKFNIFMHCFDTQVFETTLESGKLYGFGGTAFDIIEIFLQKKISSGKLKKYPYVFVITDGYGNNVYPQYPKKWYWFLKGTRKHIPQECNIFNLEDFE